MDLLPIYGFEQFREVIARVVGIFCSNSLGDIAFLFFQCFFQSFPALLLFGRELLLEVGGKRSALLPQKGKFRDADIAEGAGD